MVILLPGLIPFHYLAFMECTFTSSSVPVTCTTYLQASLSTCPASWGRLTLSTVLFTLSQWAQNRVAPRIVSRRGAQTLATKYMVNLTMVEAHDNRQCGYLPKNLSDEGYHQKHYFPKLACNRAKLRMDNKLAKSISTSTDCDQPTSPGDDSISPSEMERSCSLQSDDSTTYSEDYTDMTEIGNNSDVELRTPPKSVSSDNFSDRSSLPISSNGDEDIDMHLTGAFSKLLKRGDVDKVKKNAKHKKPDIHLLMNRDELQDPLPSPENSEPEKSKDDGHIHDGGFYEDREFEFLRTEKPRRSTSLKSCKTPPGTPSRKKAVRFADALGLDLESVRHILNLDTPPKIPDSARRYLQIGLEDEHKHEGSRYLTACFSQPGALPDFNLRVEHKKVMLENCLVDDRSMTITGTVRVANVAYHKSVVVRYTINGWVTHLDANACYVHNSNDIRTDRFSFTINVPLFFSMGSKLEFALMYHAGGETYWDNNYGSNYGIECYARQVPTDDTDQSWVHFM